MSPNKVASKNKPLLSNNMNAKMPMKNNTANLNYQSQPPYVDVQNKFMGDARGQPVQTNPVGWKNVKSPRSPQI